MIPDINKLLDAKDARIAALAAALIEYGQHSRSCRKMSFSWSSPCDCGFQETKELLKNIELPSNAIRPTSETPGEYKPEAVARILAARDAPAERSFPNGEGLMEWLHDGKPETSVYPYQQPSNLPAQSISNTTTCPKCGGPYLSIPRMGISHICSEPSERPNEQT